MFMRIGTGAEEPAQKVYNPSPRIQVVMKKR